MGELIEYADTGSRLVHVPSWLAKPVLSVLSTFGLIPLYSWAFIVADREYVVSLEKIRSLGWKAKYSNTDTLKRSYDWFVEHYDEFKDRKGVSHRVMWKEGVLKVVRWFMGLRFSRSS